MRIRSIRPEFWHGEKVLTLSPWARLLLLGINGYCDDEGRGEWSPLSIRGFIFPDKSVAAVRKWLDELVASGTIRKYEVGGKSYLDIPNWHSLQRPNHPTPSKLPPFTEDSRSPTGALTKDSSCIVQYSKGQYSKGVGVSRFEQFWQAYPKKKSKGQAEKVFAKLSPDEQLLATILAKIEQAKKSKEWRKDGGQFIPYPATWLGAKGWEDEYGPAIRKVETLEDRRWREGREERARWNKQKEPGHEQKL